MTYVAVRVRGHAGVRGEIEDTLGHLRLHKVNHAVVVPTNDSYEGMLRKARDYIAYGRLNPATLAQALRSRGKVEGDKPLTDAYLAEHSTFRTIDDLANAIANGQASLKDVPGLKPVLRLNPPRRGYGGNKRHYPMGALGDWGEDINDLVQRMV
ncbi:MAG TPA: 50S ribosomal protein L30 [Candidatus Thermoplasmatota archaeon]|jgi:large subunit ribosomal protein L30|nr:50S ribosomal protein L30 [Candidatus Thermoplasmatota archaeon]